MTSDLRARAAAATEPSGGWPTPAQPGEGAPAYTPAELPDVEYTDPITDAEAVPVHVAWARVMADVRSIGKGSRFSAPGAGTFNFRGVDEVLNHVAPAVRRHGIVIMPIRVVAEARDTKTSKGATMRETVVTVDYMVIGPKGDALPHPGQSRGEALDTMDKGSTKALSVALRNFYIQALSIPTQDLDPEADTAMRGLERGSARPRATDYRDEILDRQTSLGRLKQMRGEIAQHNLGQVAVVNENGDEEALGAMLQRIGRERQDGAGS